MLVQVILLIVYVVVYLQFDMTEIEKISEELKEIKIPCNGKIEMTFANGALVDIMVNKRIRKKIDKKR